jgi:glycosyltransferase involved in cell wall biosynthesis
VKRICILVVSYNVADHLLKTLDRIPREVFDRVEEVVITDNASQDSSYDLALAYQQSRGLEKKITVLRNPKNRGYGGNQKRGYQYAVARGFDVVVLLHGDGQYAPEILQQIIDPVANGEVAMVMGSRMATGCDPRAGGMPLYKYYGNRITTWTQNRLTSMGLSEFHSGYRAYSCHALRRIPLVQTTDNWHFDTQILLELHARRFRIREVPIPTFYGDEISHVNGIPYVMHCVWECVKYRSTRLGFWRSRLYDRAASESEVKDHLGSAHNTILGLLASAPSGSRILEVGTGSANLDRALQAEGHSVTAVDFDPRSAEQSCSHCAEMLVGDVEELDLARYAATFDYVILGSTIERMKSPEAALHKILRTLKPGGRVLACVPNVANLYVRLKLMAGRFDYEPKGIMDPGHLRFFTLHSLHSLLQHVGLEVEDTQVTPVPLPQVYPESAAKGWFKLLYRALYGVTRRFRKLLGYQFVVLAEKSPWLNEMHEQDGNQASRALAAGR